MTASASDAALEPGESFGLRATVRNRGDAGASATTLRYYRSSDATIATTDAQVGTDAVDALAASGSSAESVRLTAPSTSGTYYYGACVDAVEGESDTTNNCSSPVGVDVAEPTAPDLEVGTPAVDDASPAPGGSLTLSATVTNAGDGAASATTLRYYRSSDATITRSDAQVGTDAVDALAASGSSAESIALTATTAAGPYYYGACVDAVPDESHTANNCSHGVRVTVMERRYPDLTVFGSSTLKPKQRCWEDETVTTRVTVRNTGNDSASSTTLRYYRSPDASVSSDDEQIGSATVPALTASDSWSHELVRLSASGYYYACADPLRGEPNTGNNCSAPFEIALPARAPADLGLKGLSMRRNRIDSPYTNLGVDIHNYGEETGLLDRAIRVFRSSDAAISADDVEVHKSEPLLDPQRIHGGLGCGPRKGFYLQSSSGPSDLYYYACLDASPSDANRSNDCSGLVKWNWSTDTCSWTGCDGQ